MYCTEKYRIVQNGDVHETSVQYNIKKYSALLYLKCIMYYTLLYGNTVQY